MHACILCEESFETLPQLVAHLLYHHQGEHRLWPSKNKESWQDKTDGLFSIKPNHWAGWQIDCFCGREFYTQMREIAPAFWEWAQAWKEFGSHPFARHLIDAGGLAKHFEQEQSKAALTGIQQFAATIVEVK